MCKHKEKYAIGVEAEQTEHAPSVTHIAFFCPVCKDISSDDYFHVNLSLGQAQSFWPKPTDPLPAVKKKYIDNNFFIGLSIGAGIMIFVSTLLALLMN